MHLSVLLHLLLPWIHLLSSLSCPLLRLSPRSGIYSFLSCWTSLLQDFVPLYAWACTYMYVFSHMCRCMYRHVCRYVCVEAREQPQVPFIRSCHLVFWNRVSHLAWHLLVRVDLTSKTQGSHISFFLGWNYKWACFCFVLFAFWLRGFQTQVLKILWKGLYRGAILPYPDMVGIYIQAKVNTKKLWVS